MPARIAIYHPPASAGLGKNPFGKDVANLGLWRALAQHGGFGHIDILGNGRAPMEPLREALLQGRASTTRFETHSILNQRAAAEAGTLFRGTADLTNLSWLRRLAVGDRAYSLVGLVHTIAPPAIRSYIAEAALAPTQPWDALICTSPAIVQGLTEMFDAFGEHVNERFGGAQRPRPQLPLIPLGVDFADLKAKSERGDRRAAMRAELGLSEDDILVLWVGRLSFFEKAFPQPMFRAVEEAARASGRKAAFLMTGWFPVEPKHREVYQQAAAAYAPSVQVRFADGNDPETLARSWAGADIFISLVDNIQETFGITPLEAMASGLPVVASDWDGYRYTIQDGVQGFLVPTLGAPGGGLGASLAAPHALMLLQSYQTYAGTVAQHTAVNVGRAAAALAELMRSPELRRKMGEAGRVRVRATFDWPVVARHYAELADELAGVRAAAAGPDHRGRPHPVKGDPFAAFAHFASATLSPQTRLRLHEGAGPADLPRAQGVQLDVAFGDYQAEMAEREAMVRRIAEAGEISVEDLTAAFPAHRRQRLELSLVWMAKLGILDWA